MENNNNYNNQSKACGSKSKHYQSVLSNTFLLDYFLHFPGSGTKDSNCILTQTEFSYFQLRGSTMQTLTDTAVQ